jgi:glycosyltransferase involved in cell wall biosynthesis
MKQVRDGRTKVIRLVPELDFGGVESGIVVQAGLIDRDRFDFRVCTFWKDGASAAEIRKQGIPVDVLGADPSIYKPSATLALAGYLRRMRPDVLHASITEADFHAALLAPFRWARRTTIDEAGFPEIARWRRRVVFRGLNRLVDDVIVVSQRLGEFLARHEGAPRRKIRFIPNCGSPRFFTDRKHDYRVQGARFRLGVVGRLVEVKNHATLIEALALIDEPARPEIWLFGEGPLKARLLAQAERLGVSEQVKLQGYKPGWIGDTLKSLDGFAQPSFAEGCSLALIEAMALGLPVLTSKADGNLEVMGPLASGWTIDAGDAAGWATALRQLAARSPDERRSHGDVALQRAHARYSPQAYVAALDALYEGRGADTTGRCSP